MATQTSVNIDSGLAIGQQPIACANVDYAVMINEVLWHSPDIIALKMVKTTLIWIWKSLIKY